MKGAPSTWSECPSPVGAGEARQPQKAAFVWLAPALGHPRWKFIHRGLTREAAGNTVRTIKPFFPGCEAAGGAGT